MNGELLQRIVEEIVSRVERRAQSTITLSAAQLRETDPTALFCQYSSLHISHVALPLLAELAENESSDATATLIHEALAMGIRIQISLQQGLLRAIPLKKLARLPLAFRDELGQPVTLHPDKLLSYADVAHLKEGWLVLRHQCVVTALAREAAGTRNIQLIKQE